MILLANRCTYYLILLIILFCGTIRSQDNEVLPYNWQWRLGSSIPWKIPEFESSVLWYKFDEATNVQGRIVDSSVYSNSVGIPTNITYILATNFIGANYAFNPGGFGSKNYIQPTNRYDFLLTDGVNDKAFSFVCWYKKNSTAARSLLGRSRGSTVFEEYHINYNTLYFANVNSVYTLVLNSKNAAYNNNLIAAWGSGANNQLYSYNMFSITYDGSKDPLGIKMYEGTNILTMITTNVGTYTGQFNHTNYTWFGSWLGGGADFPLAGNAGMFLMYTNKVITHDNICNIYTNTWFRWGWTNSLARLDNSMWLKTAFECNFDTPNWANNTAYYTRNYLSYGSSSTYPIYTNIGNRVVLKFDGIDDALRSNGRTVINTGTNAIDKFSLQAWINPQTNGTYSQLIQGLGGSLGVFLYFRLNHGTTNSSLGIYTSNGVTVKSTNTAFSSTICTGQWVNVGVTYDKTNMPSHTFYFNGQALSPTLRYDNVGYQFADIIIGDLSGLVANNYMGLLGNITVFNDCLSSNEMYKFYDYYNEMFGVPE